MPKSRHDVVGFSGIGHRKTISYAKKELAHYD